MHRLLRRQLRRHFGDDEKIPEEIRRFLDAVDSAYRQADEDRLLLERSLELTSHELLERNAQLVRDIEARRRAESALRTSEARVRAIIDALPDLLYVIDADGTIVEAHAHGSTPPPPLAHAVNRHLRDVFPRSSVTAAMGQLARVRETGRAQDFELSIQVGDETRQLEARFVPADQQRVVAILRDVTENRRMHEQLLISERMASVGTLAAGVVHEINNPLTFVLANLGHLAEELDRLDRLYDLSGSSDVLAAVSEAWNGAVRVRRIVRELRTFSRSQDEGLSAVDVRDAIESAVSVALPEIRHRARLEKVYTQVPHAHADASRLGQVILNLLVNAAQALPFGRVDEHRITVRTREDDEGNPVVEVHDDGPGIPAEVLPRIWDAFYSTKPVGVGTGLGLAICRKIVTGFGGDLSVTSAPGDTTFRVHLVRSEATSHHLTTSSAPPPVAARRARVLVIDDEPDVGSSIRRVLSRHDVTVTHGGREGLERIAREDYDVILCDLVMPDLTGMELYDLVSEERPEMAARFLFMTGGAFMQGAQEFLRTRAPGYIDKPFDVIELRSLIDARLTTS